MKTKNIFKLGLLSLLASVLCVPSFINLDTDFTQKEIKASVYDVDSYYKDAQGLTGNALLTKLHKIINDGFKSVGYDGLFEAYKYTDVKDDGYLNDIYSNTSKYKVSSGRCGNYKKEGDCWNREHSIPKSWWGGGKSPQYSDIFILYPSDGYVNGRRSNIPLGEVSTVKYASNNNFSKLGTSAISGGGSSVFEPNDKYKGDLARTYFYALTKYDAETWTSGSGSIVFSGSKDLNFGLTNYALNLFLKWNELDPVDDWERHRNEGAYTQQFNRNPYIDHPEWINYIWGNGKSDIKVDSVSISGDSSMYVNSSLQLSASVSPNNAPQDVYWSSSNDNIATVSSSGLVTSINEGNVTITATSSVDKTKIATKTVSVLKQQTIDLENIYLTTDVNKIVVNELTKINITLSPSNVSPLPTYKYFSIDENIAKVDLNGQIRGINEGTTKIGVSAYQENRLVVTKYIDIVVIKNSIVTSNIYQKVTSNDDTLYGNYLIVNEDDNVIYNSSKDSQSSINKVNISNNKIILDESLSNAYVQIEPVNGSYSIRATTGSYISGKSKTIVYSNEIITNKIVINNSSAYISSDNYYLRYNSSAHIFRYYSSGQSDICLYKAINDQQENVLTGLKIEQLPDKTNYEINDEFNITGLKVIALYLDGTSQDVTDLVTLSNIDLSTSGTKEIKVSYKDVFTSFIINVSNASIASVEKAYKIVESLNDGEVSKSISFTGIVTNIIDNNSLFIQENGFAIYVKSYQEISDNVKINSRVLITSKLTKNNGLIETLSGDAIIEYVNDDSIISSINLTNYDDALSANQNILVNADGLIYVKGSINQSSSYELKMKCFNNEISMYVSNHCAYKYFETMNKLKANDTLSIRNVNILHSNNNSLCFILGDNSIIEANENINYAREFIDDFSSDTNAEKEPSISDWNKLKSIYENLSDADKEKFATAQANENGNEVERCVALYDKIIQKYGSNQYEDFMHRFNDTNNDSTQITTNEQIMTFIALSCALLVTVSFVVYLFVPFKFKKH